MPKALVLCGSARSGGSTDAMCQGAADALVSAGYDVEMVRVPVRISHCLDCGLCMDGRCVIEDGMGRIYSAFQDADLLVLATPIHFSGPSSLVKTAIDRYQPWWWEKSSPHPDAVLGLMCGGSDSPEYGPTCKIFKAFAAMLGMRWLGHLEVSGTDRTGAEGVREASCAFVSDLLAP